VKKTIELAKDNGLQETMKQNMAALAITNADEVVADEILKLI
jgi:hypothetical protein